MFWPRMRLFMQRYWIWVAIVALLVVVIIFPIWYLAGMEESVRRYIVGINIASLPWGVLQTLIFVGFLYLLHYGGGFSSLKKTRVDASGVNVKFSEVIGLSEAKREAMEVVELLKDRALVKKIGGKILKGLLLVGPPGCGKTMLAKAIATETSLPFLSIAGSEFVEIFVGVGAARVRKLFKQARQYAQAYGGCLIFIDELEVVGRSRVFYDAFGGSSEGNSTLNQLLVEMDGLQDAQANVVVIGAMNASIDVLDPALMRPGRFDRKISIGRPNLQDRQEVFLFYAGKLKVDPSMDFGRLARRTVYYSPAEIENVLQEGALIAARHKHEAITYKDLSAALERIELGAAERPTLSPHEREMTAFHEAGHLVVMYLTHPTRDVFKASIIKRGGVLGVVHGIPREELHSNDRHTYFANVKVSLAGYVSEKLKYGVTTDGVGADFVNAMALAHQMVWNIGMSSDGYVGNFAAMPAGHISDSLKERLNVETETLLRSAMKEVEVTLKAEWHILERFVKELLSKEELDYDEIAAIFMEYGKPPKIPLSMVTGPAAGAAPPPPALGGPSI